MKKNSSDETTDKHTRILTRLYERVEAAFLL